MSKYHMNEREGTKMTQNQRVIAYLEQFGSITQLEALRDLGIMRLASRISDLKKLGFTIESTTEAVQNRWEEKCYIKRYRLVKGANV